MIKPEIKLLVMKIAGKWVLRADICAGDSGLACVFNMKGTLEDSLPSALKEAEAFLTEEFAKHMVGYSHNESRKTN